MKNIIENLKTNLKKSSFIVNKLYLFIIFIFLSISDLTLGLIYFFISFFIYIKKLLTSSVPMEIHEDIKVETYVYKKTEKKDLKVDIYYPNSNKSFYPLVYFCHGGGWISGFRDQPNNVSWCKYLASKGYVVSSIDYRYGYRNTMLDLTSDYSDGLKFLKDNYYKFKIDKQNIVLMGLSAGGHLALLYSTYLTYNRIQNPLSGVKAVVAYYPPTDLQQMVDNKDSKSIFAKFGTVTTLNNSPSEFNDPYEFYSPIQWVNSKMPPTLLVHGKMDDTVPFETSVEFAKALKRNKVEYEFLVHSTANHSFDTKNNDYTTISIIEKTVRFINKHTNN